MDARIMNTHLRLVLVNGTRMLQSLDGGERVAKPGGAYGDLADDTEIRADQILGLAYQKQLLGIKGVATVRVEGLPLAEAQGKTYHVICDPLDGSLNYKTRGGGLGLPYSACVALFDGTDLDALRYRDIRNAGCIDYRSSLPEANSQAHVWDAWREDGGYAARFLGKPCQTLREERLDLGRMIVIGEMYYPENREKLCRAFAGKKGWLRNPGSAVYEMALVASGTVAAYVCDRQKQHELPTGVALVLGAGGVAVDFDGKPLLDAPFDFDAQQPAILACSQAIADQLLELLRR